MQITISGTASLCIDDDNCTPVSDPAILKQLDGCKSGRDDDDAFASYIDSRELREIGLRGGYIELQYDTGDRVLRVVTEYESPRPLSDDELRKLVQHTTDQWSDGLGESFECEYASNHGYELDLAPMDQAVTVVQH